MSRAFSFLFVFVCCIYSLPVGETACKYYKDSQEQLVSAILVSSSGALWVVSPSVNFTGETYLVYVSFFFFYCPIKHTGDIRDNFLQMESWITYEVIRRTPAGVVKLSPLFDLTKRDRNTSRHFVTTPWRNSMTSQHTQKKTIIKLKKKR